MFNLFQNLPNLVRNNSTYSTQNPVLSRNQNFYQNSDWLTSTEKVFTELTDVERLPYPYYKPTYGTEILGLQNQVTELYERVKKLEQKEEQKLTHEEQETFPIEFLESEKLVLKRPITVRAIYSPEDKTWVVDHFELNIYGEGRDIDEAVRDFKLSLEEVYFDLKADKDKLGPALEKEWKLLNQIIKEK